MKRLLFWLGSEKGKGAGFSLLSLGNSFIALITFLRFAEIAKIFGTSWKTDAFAVAMVFPMLVQQIISHAFGSSFIPIYSRVRHKSGVEATNQFVSRIISWITVSGSCMIVVLVLFSRTVVIAAGPGLESNTLNLASMILRVALPTLVLASANGILLSFLTYEKRFGLVSFVRILEIAVSYGVIVFGHSSLGIMVLPVSVVAGCVVAFAASLGLSIRLRFRFTPILDPRDQDFLSLVRLAVPVIVGTLVGFLGPISDKFLASFLRESSVTAIDYANRLKNMVMVIFLQPLIALANITFSKEAAKKDTPSLRKELTVHLNWTSFLMVPAAAYLTVLAVPVVSLLFQRGQFTAADARYVGYAVMFYAPWLAQFGFGAIISRAFYALKDSMVPVLIGIWGIVANVLLNIILIGSMGIGGLALATTVTSTAKTAMLVYCLRGKIGKVGEKGLVSEQVKVFASTLIMSCVMLLMMHLLRFDESASLMNRLLKMLCYVTAGAVSYLASLVVLGSLMLTEVLNSIRKRIGR